MKLRLKPLVYAVSVTLLSTTSGVVFAQDQTSVTSAATTTTTAPSTAAAVSSTNETTTTTTASPANPEENPKVQALVKKINNQIDAQQDKITQLKAEVNTLNSQLTTVKSQQKSAASKAEVANQAASSAAASAAQSAAQAQKTADNNRKLLELGASPVITAPYLGVPSRWDASDLIVNQPTYNEDILLMQRDSAMDKALVAKGFQKPVNPLLEMSGKVEVQGWDQKPMSGANSSDIDLTGAELDFAVHVTDWVNGITSFVYDNGPPNANGSTNQQIVTNSRVFVTNAFITVGDLDKSPLYGTMGQRVVPYGHYSSFMLSDTYPQIAFRTRARALLVGYNPMTNQLGPYANIFVFRGDTETGGGATNINDIGSDIGYLFCRNIFTGDFGVSAISNVANSLGMQANGITNSSEFRGFGFAPNNGTAETLQRNVPGINAHAKLGISDYTFLGEANTATSSFAYPDLYFNNHGAKPAAAHLEAAYSFNMGRFPSSVAIGYDHTWQALALAIPQTRYISTFSTSFFKDTIESLEIKREINYAYSDTAGGQDVSVSIPGHYANTITAQIGYYF